MKSGYTTAFHSHFSPSTPHFSILPFPYPIHALLPVILYLPLPCIYDSQNPVRKNII